MLTPNNRARKVFIDPVLNDCWITNADYPNLANLVTEYGATAVNNLIVVACARINKMCNRYFNTQQADEIFINDASYYNGYYTYVLKNSPITTIDDIYLQVNESFGAIDLSYLQVFTAERTIKVLPNVITSLTTALFASAELSTGKLNLWIRYTSGYAKADVPSNVKYATALMVEHLASGQSGNGDVVEFATQTYREKRAKSSESPLYSMIQDLIKPYKLYTAK
jgi:hypothetical protein